MQKSSRHAVATLTVTTWQCHTREVVEPVLARTPRPPVNGALPTTLLSHMKLIVPVSTQNRVMHAGNHSFDN